jgi:hypothetical protein
MKKYSLLPVAQPLSFGTTVDQSNSRIPAPVHASLVPVRAIRTSTRIVEFDYLRVKYQQAHFQTQLEALIAMPALMMRGRSGKEWTRFAQEITNQAMFIQASSQGAVHIQEANFYGEEFNVSVEVASTLTFFTKLCCVLGQLGRIDIPIHLEGEYKKQSFSGGESGLNFVYALQGFLPRANMEVWHKQHINGWINRRLPECDWLPMPELYPTMQVVSSLPKSRGRKPRACPSTFEEALAGGFKTNQLAELVSRQHLAFYDVASKQAFAEPRQWASLYWALFSMGYVQKITMGRVPELIAASFNGITSKSSISAIYRSELEDKTPAKNTETARICDIIKTHFTVK